MALNTYYVEKVRKWIEPETGPSFDVNQGDGGVAGKTSGEFSTAEPQPNFRVTRMRRGQSKRRDAALRQALRAVGKYTQLEKTFMDRSTNIETRSMMETFALSVIRRQSLP